MHSSPPFPHVQHAQDHIGDTLEEIVERNFKQGFILLLVFAAILALGLVE